MVDPGSNEPAASRQSFAFAPMTTGVELLNGEQLRRQHGYGMRIGVRGLWGGFGLLQTDRQPLLLTPESPERFVAALSAR